MVALQNKFRRDDVLGRQRARLGDGFLHARAHLAQRRDIIRGVFFIR